MAVWKVRLDEDGDRILTALARDTGLSVSVVLKKGLLALRDERMACYPDAY